MRRAGNGSCTFGSGDRYEGGWRDDAPQGTGTMKFAATGDTYVGEWASGRPHGAGSLRFADGGGAYDGAFVDGVIRGAGRLVVPLLGGMCAQRVTTATCRPGTECR